MAQFNYDGNLEGLTPSQLDFISKVLTELGLELGTVEVTPVGVLGDNYQATVKRLTINNLKIICKIAPAIESIRAQMNTEIVFRNETLVYEVLLPKFDELQKAAGIEKPLVHAKCYGILKEKLNEMILLEDLNVKGFHTLSRLEPLSDECIRLVIKDFSLFHALSFALQQKEPNLYQDLCSELKSVFDVMDEMLIVGMEMMEKQMMGIMDNEEFKEKVKGFLTNEFLQYPQLEKEDAEAGKTVIIQGDAWTNNILFKFKDEKVNDCIMIDYQMSRQGNPITDLNYFIFNCSDYQTRTKNYHNWINSYYKELTKTLAKFDIDSENIYTRETLDNDMKRYSKVALATSLMFNGLVIRESDSVFDFKKEMEENVDMKMEELMEKAGSHPLGEKTVLRIRERLNGLIQSFIDLGYI